MGSSPWAIRAEEVARCYGTVTALAGFNLTVGAGRVHGLLGPNGAGKTSAVRILATLLRPDAGRAEVAGFDVVRQAEQVRSRIGLVGQYAALDEILSGRQNLLLFGRLYHLSPQQARQRADELLHQFGLADTGRKPVGHYSGGMRRRLDLAASLLVAPPVLFLDEPTSGLDPRSRNAVWDAVRALVAEGTTVLLTTQYLEEADQLADTISVIDHGRVIATGSPDQLKAQFGGDRLDVVLRDDATLATVAALLERVAGTTADIDQDTRRVSAAVADRMASLSAVVRALDDAGIAPEDIVLRRPTLDEVFLHLTADGRAAPKVRTHKELA